MNILADENCARAMVGALRAAGHDVVTILDLSPSLDDLRVFALAKAESRVLLTNDHDFGLIAERADVRPPSIVLMRLEPLSLALRIEIVVRAFADFGEDVIGQFVVVEPHQIRMHSY